MSTHMVDITPKIHVKRIATAEGFIKLKRETLTLIREGRVRKGDVFSVAKIAGILAAKNVPQIIPLCHQIPLTHVDLNFKLEEDGVRVKAVVKAIAKTGVEMEALTAVSVAYAIGNSGCCFPFNLSAITVSLSIKSLNLLVL